MQQWLAEAELAKLHIAYAWALDAKDVESILSLFSENVRFDLSEYNVPPVSGKAALRHLYTELLSQADRSFSSISNIRVEATGETATGGDYFMHYSYYDSAAGGPTRGYSEGQHFYSFVKEHGTWKIDTVRVHFTFRSP